ncbi:MAG TPA: phage tail protein [Methanoregulaceae archaeon]|nr:phage tail protein [Methanoregulaceae archaeon]
MAEFPVNTHRHDPYKNYKFLIMEGNNAVLGVSKVSALKRTTEVVKHRDGGSNSYDHKSPGRTTYDAISFDRGLTHDPKFAEWANSVHPYNDDNSMDLVNYKRELALVVLNERGKPVHRYSLHGCWVSEYTAVPDLDANANAIAIEHIKMEVDGWERDKSLSEEYEG